MTQAEWEDRIEDWYDLRSWCLENGCFEDEMYDIIDDYELNDSINEDINNFDGDWMSLRDNLDDISTGYTIYRRDGSFDYVPLDDRDFRDKKEEVLDYLVEIGYFDPEEEEATEEDDEEIEPFEPELPEPEPADTEESEPWTIDFDLDTIFAIASVNVAIMMDSRPVEPERPPVEPEPADDTDLSELIPLF